MERTKHNFTATFLKYETKQPYTEKSARRRKPVSTTPPDGDKKIARHNTRF